MALLLFATAVILLFFTSAQLMTRNKQPFHFCMVIGCAFLAYVLFYTGASTTGLLQRVPALIGTDVSAIFITAPAFYLASLTILHEGRRPVRRYSTYFIAPTILALGSWVYSLIAAPAYLKGTGTIPGHLFNPLWACVSFAAALLLGAAIILDLLAARRLYKAGLIRNVREVQGQVVFLFLYLAAELVFLAGFVFANEPIARFGCLSFGLIAVGYALSRTGVSFFSRGGTEPRFRRTRPDWDGSTSRLTARLKESMETAAPYRDPDLTLRGLARLLGEEPRRLSYYFNVGLATTFRSYINEWRLNAVVQDLHRNPNRSILSTAFENGFNSKTSFNTLFRAKFGKTPREVRKEKPDALHETAKNGLRD